MKRPILNSFAKKRLRAITRDFADLNREVIVLEVDLTNPKNRIALSSPDRPPNLEVLPMRMASQLLLRSLEEIEPNRAGMVKRRLQLGMDGFVLLRQAEVLGYMFFTPGTTGSATTHGDLRWLGIKPQAHEIYAFDYFVSPESRGVGAPFVKMVQEEQYRLGSKKSFGYVFADNRAALWLYRITGWKEVKRLKEHRFLRNHLAVIERTLYFMHPYARTPLFSW